MAPKYLSLWKRTRRAIASILLYDDVQVIDMERESFIAAQQHVEQGRQEFEAYKKQLRVTDMVRELLVGFNPRLLDVDDNRGPEGLLKDSEVDSFLASAKDLLENPTLTTILDHLTRNQIQESVCRARTFEQNEFGKATINGFSLLREELERLAAVYAERHPQTETFDAHGVV